METAGYILAITAGISLGLTGSGGSILTVPILVYFFSVSPALATTYSLFIVGISALTGSVKYYRQGNLQLCVAMVFGMPALIALLFIRKYILPQMPKQLFSFQHFIITKDILLMVVFAGLMIIASLSMIYSTYNMQLPHYIKKGKLFLIGFSVGIITGFLGAGGGFLIIPALIFFAGLEMKQAVGTSLLIIAANALIGFAGDMLNGVIINFHLLLKFSVFTVAGVFTGIYLSKKIDAKLLKLFFGWLLLLTGLCVIVKEIFFHQ